MSVKTGGAEHHALKALETEDGSGKEYLLKLKTRMNEEEWEILKLIADLPKLEKLLNKTFVPNEELLRALPGISESAFGMLRARKAVKYYKIGKKIYYPRDVVLDLINHYIYVSTRHELPNKLANRKY